MNVLLGRQIAMETKLASTLMADTAALVLMDMKAVVVIVLVTRIFTQRPLLLTYYTDINECVGSNNCSKNATCVNTLGSYACYCNAYYSGDGYSCTGMYGPGSGI